MAKTSVISEFFGWISFLIKAIWLKWQTSIKIKKLDNYIKDKIGRIRFSGTTTTSLEQKLPATFKLREQTYNGDGTISFYCAVIPDPSGDVVWVDNTAIIVNSRHFKLLREPSRTVDPQIHPETPLIVRGEVFYPSWQERVKFTVRQ